MQSIFNETPYQEAYQNFKSKILEEIQKINIESVNLYSDIPRITYTLAKKYRNKNTYEWFDNEKLQDYLNPTIWEYNSPNYTTLYFINKNDHESAINTHFYELISEYIKANLYK